MSLRSRITSSTAACMQYFSKLRAAWSLALHATFGKQRTTDHWAIVCFKDGEKLVLSEPGNVVLDANGTHYQLPHQAGVARVNAEDVKYITQQRRSGAPKKARNVLVEDDY